MSKFEGGTLRVRCVDCTKLSANQCIVKGAKVSPKKRRTCSIYEFKGEFENREPLPAIYFPPVDKKTEKMIKKLLKMGVVPVADGGDVSIDKDGRIVQEQKFEMPKSTATASVVGTKSNVDAQLSNPNELASLDAQLVDWTPENEEIESSPDNGRG